MLFPQLLWLLGGPLSFYVVVSPAYGTGNKVTTKMVDVIYKTIEEKSPKFTQRVGSLCDGFS